MKSIVYFADARARSARENKTTKMRVLFEKAGFAELISKDALSAVKVHFGEKGSDSYIRPVLVRPLIDKIKEAGGTPFLTDTNTLYSGSRFNAVDHIRTAIENGFDYAVVGAPVIIADGLKSKNVKNVNVDTKHFESVIIAADIVAADNLMVISHFKGHELTGFGGAIKNVAMGCASASGKKEQHRPGIFVIKKRCVNCGQCIALCPVNAIQIEQEKAVINRDVCTGCGECMTICPHQAIEFDWNTELIPFVERMVEYAYGVLSGKQGKVGYVNVLLNIVPDCDCVPWSDASIVPDIGILASTDPVAIDKASYDLVHQQIGLKNTHLKCNYKSGEDKFKGTWSQTNSLLQIEYSEKLGLGSSTYELVKI